MSRAVSFELIYVILLYSNLSCNHYSRIFLMEIKEYDTMFKIEDTHFWFRGMRMITKALLDQSLPKKQNNSILDAGCGTGANMVFLKQYGITYGFDISSLAINYCKKRKLKYLQKASIIKIPYKNNYFDLVTNFDVLYHKNVSSDSKAINELHRVLKPGGMLLIRVPAFQWLYSQHDYLVHTKQRYSKNQIIELLKSKKQFSIIKVTYANCILFPFIALKRILQKKRSYKV